MQSLAGVFLKSTKNTSPRDPGGALRHLEVLWWAGGVQQGPPHRSEVVGCDGGRRSLLTEVLVELRL